MQHAGLQEYRDPQATITTTSTGSEPDIVITSTFSCILPLVGTYAGKGPL